MSGRKFTELNAGTVGANSIFAQAQAPATPGDPYTSTKVSATDVGNFVNGTQAYADIGNVTPLAAIAALQQGGASTANANIADEYDSSHTYNAGDRVIYEGVLYVCNDDNVTGAWDSTKWDSATIDEIISALTAADIPYSAGVSVADKLAASMSVLEKGTYTMSINGFFTANADGTLAIVPHTSVFCASDVTRITKGTVNTMTISLYDGTRITPTNVSDLSLQTTNEITFTLAGSVGVRKMGYANVNLTFTLS